MNSQEWNTVLVDWVNCLKISPPIQSTKDLRNGEFLTNLNKLLFKHVDESLDTLPTIIKVLQKQYPNYKFRKEHNVFLEDLSEDDLISIMSLLMHYSCCLNRQEVLTSPMCHQLSQATQLSVRTFLEKVHNNINETELNQIVKESVFIENMKSHVVSNWFSAGDSSVCNTSPLQDFLKTPLSKINRLHEKDRELHKLQLQLEMEQYEKCDLQDELQQQIDKNKKLDTQLKQKLAEVTRLRGEIVALENRTPPHFLDANSREVQRRLRGEIEDLENYVAKLETDNESLQKENDAMKEKVRKLEIQCSSMQEKVRMTENNNDHLTEKSQQQEEELQSLKIHCNQLSSMLEEFRSQRSHNQSAVEVYDAVINRSMDVPAEDLACSVVEVQLRDVQRENLDLKNMLIELQTKSQLLNDELHKRKNIYDELENNFLQLQDDNLNLLAKVSLLSDTQNNLELTEEKLSQSCLKNYDLEVQNNELKRSLETSKLMLNEALSLNESLKTNLQELNLEKENYKLKLAEKEEFYKTLQKEANILKNDHQKIVEKFTNTQFELESKVKLLNQFDQDVENHLKKLESLIIKDNEFDYKNKNAVFEMLYLHIERDVNDKKSLINKLSTSEDLMKKLEEDILVLNQREAVNLAEKQTLRHELKIAQNNYTILQKTIAEYEQKISDLQNIIGELNDNIKVLEKLKETIIEKENENLILQKNNDVLSKELCERKEGERKLKDVVFTLKSNQTNLEVKLEETQCNLQNQLDDVQLELVRKIEEEKEMRALIKTLEDSMETLSNEINNKDSKIIDLNHEKGVLEQELNEAKHVISNLRDSECKLQEILIQNEKSTFAAINELNLQNENYCIKIKNLDEKLQDTIESYKKVKNEMQSLQKEKEEVEINFKINTEHLNKNILLLKSTIDKLKGDIKRNTEEHESFMKQKLLEAHDKYVLLNEEKETITAERVKLKFELDVLLKKVAEAEDKCQEKDDIISECNKRLLVLKLKMQNKNILMQKYETDINALNKEISTLKINVDQLKSKNEQDELQAIELKKEITILMKLKADLQKSYNELEETTANILKKISSKNNDLNNLIIKLDGNKKSMQNEIESLRTALQDNKEKMQSLSEEKLTLNDQYEKEIVKLNDTIIVLTNSIEMMNEKEINYVQQIRTLKEELSDTITKYTEALQVQHDIKVENEVQINDLTENLHEVVSKYNELESKYQETLLSLNELGKSHGILVDEKIKLENEILKIKSASEETYETSKNCLLEQIQLLNDDKNTLRKQLEVASVELEKSYSNESELKANVSALHDLLKKIETEKDNAMDKLSSLERDHEKLNSDYNFVQIEHEKLVKYSESSLEDLKRQHIIEINNLNKEKLLLEEHTKQTDQDLKKLQTEISDLVDKYTCTIHEQENKIKKLEGIIKDQQTKILMLNLDQEELQKRISVEKVQNEEAVTKSKNDYENTIAKLMCANDILETGKNNLEKECVRLKSHIKKLEVSIENIRQKFEAIKEEKDTEVSMLNKEKKCFVDELEIKENSLSDVEHNLLLLNRALYYIKTQNGDLNKENINLNGRLEQQEIVIKNLQQDFKEKNDLLNEMEQKTNDLVCKINVLAEDKLKLMDEINMKHEKISDLTQENNQLESKLQNSLTHISELNLKITQHLESITKLTSEKHRLENEINILNTDLQKLKKSRDEIHDAQTKMIKETENNILRAHENAIEVKNDLLKRIETAESEQLKQTELKNEIEKLLLEERNNNATLELRILELTNEKSKLIQISTLMQNSMIKLNSILQEKPVENYSAEFGLNSYSDIEKIIENIEIKVLNIIEKKTDLSNTISRLEQENLESLIKIEQLQNERNSLDKEKDKLMKDYAILIEERSLLSELKDKQNKSLKELQLEHDMLQARYEQIAEYSNQNEILLDRNKKLEHEMLILRNKSENIISEYNKLTSFHQEYKSKVNKIVSLRVSLNGLYNSIKQNLRDVQHKLKFDCNKDLIERKESFEVIFDDIHRQMNRSTKFLYDLLQNVLQIYTDSIESIFSGKINNYEKTFAELNIGEETEKLIDLKDAATDLLDKLKALSSDVDSFYRKKENLPLRENSAFNKLNIKDDDLKKKNIQLKQKLTLAECAKSNLERKVKQLREENKKLFTLGSDEHYKTLLQQHMDTKNELERMLQESDERYQKLAQEFEDYKHQHNRNDKKNIELEMQKLKEAYSNLMTDSSKFELENESLRKRLQDCIDDINQLHLVKEAYEKLLEENNKLMMELDTIKYKRSRDREEFVHLLKKEKDEIDRIESKHIQEIKNDYELKLEKMKEKMIKLYKEEVDKEMKKVLSEKNENVYLLRVIDQLKSNLKEAKLKMHETELERDKVLDKLKSLRQFENTFGSKESLTSMASQVIAFPERDSFRMSINCLSLPRGTRPSVSLLRNVEERKISTLPRGTDFNVIEEIKISRSASINTAAPDIKSNIEMEDEEDTFNTKYLVDLKEGRCNVPNDPNQNARCSELAWRNSMCPPHLKSSYPAEMQFMSPNRFKEDDIKFGNSDLDNSSTKLLPIEKTRLKKDIGTTSYKKPGPPTPSRNGGRVSLQGNEFHLKDTKEESKTPKRFTPNRLKGLFMGRNSVIKDNSESHPVTPKSKRLSIFRKPR